jgi:hypothetical protein
MTTTDTIEATAPPLIRYPNLSGAIVRVIEVKQASTNPDVWDQRFVGQCAGCLDSKGTTAYPENLASARTWAAKHAAACRALPPVDDESQSVSSVYLGEAHRLIERAREAMTRGDDEKQRAELLVTVANSMVGFALAAHQIEAC